jgi:DNA invertase Pin-like site-specific DNA recombinase
MTKVAIYARYSSDNQRDASIEDQLRICREHAAKVGWSIFDTYTDHGLSGASMMRPGIQAMMQDAMAGRFDHILAESLDRLSRDQEDVAGIFKRLSFAGVKIVTLSEGEISHLHIGLKGTMNALYLKDLADKTRRGLRGRVEAGKSGGGNSYGYDVVKQFNEDGEAVRGERRINEKQATIVQRIFTEYAAGASPRAIAKQLNSEGVGGPSGKGWGPSTIHGNRQRGTGILNNELYIGRLVWNRLKYVKAPDTGKRISRLNPEEDWIIQDVPEMRIIDQDIWERVKARQAELELKKVKSEQQDFWDRRRPRHLFSGLMKCGVCGGGIVNLNAERAGCANARNKGTCDNKRTIRRDTLETTVLDGLKNHLMDPELCALFAEEYTAHRNQLLMDHNAELVGARAELGKITREIDRLIQAIIDGVPGAQVKDKMGQLEARKIELEAKLEDGEEETVLIHPEMGRYYRDQVAALSEALGDEDYRAEAVAIIRTLVDKVVLTPIEFDGKKTVAIDLHGELAGILSLASNAKKPLKESDFCVESIKLVAGVGFEPTTFRL